MDDSKWQNINKFFIVVTLLGVIALSLTIVQLWASIPTTLTMGVLEFMLFIALVVQFLFMKAAFFNSKKRIRKIQTITNIRQETYTLKKIINRASSLYEHEKSRLGEFNSFYLEVKLSEAEVVLRTAEGILKEVDGK